MTLAERTYICQHCAKASPESEWKGALRTICPKCGMSYSWLMAQDSEDD